MIESFKNPINNIINPESSNEDIKSEQSIRPLSINEFIGQKDINIIKARKILKNKIIGITCHNSIKLVKRAILDKANYIAIGAFYSSKTKKEHWRQPYMIRGI